MASGDPDLAVLDSVVLVPVDRARVDQEQADRERATSAQGNRAVRVKVPAALAEARERPAVGVTRHRESGLHALRALARVPWPSKPG